MYYLAFLDFKIALTSKYFYLIVYFVVEKMFVLTKIDSKLKIEQFLDLKNWHFLTELAILEKSFSVDGYLQKYENKKSLSKK